MKIRKILIFIAFFTYLYGSAQDANVINIFKNTPVNFGGKKPHDSGIQAFQDGRIVIKKITAPVYSNGSDIKVKATLRSAGDRWDKSGSVFIIKDTSRVNLLSVLRDNKTYPSNAGLGEYKGIIRSESYTPALEILRFMTPFGVGFYSDEVAHPKLKLGRPVSVPAWAKEVSWEADVSHLAEALTGTFYIGVWIDTWTAEGYEIDVTLNYSGRPLAKPKILPLVNTIYYAGQKYPDNFAFKPLQLDVRLPADAKNVKLWYITTGHGGHSGGDEFIKIKNTVKWDKKIVLDTIPWREDCAAFRRFNPTSGVWIEKDSARFYGKSGKREIKVIEERLASSDLSRSNWCPGSKVLPYPVLLGNLKKGIHHLEIDIDATPIDGDKLNHWLVSVYLTYEE
ncbi:MAG: N-glycanase [Flavobacteriales bacterium]|nr:MAG: N-glycanase [Flavobacteriales bacterium]